MSSYFARESGWTLKSLFAGCPSVIAARMRLSAKRLTDEPLMLNIVYDPKALDQLANCSLSSVFLLLFKFGRFALSPDGKRDGLGVVRIVQLIQIGMDASATAAMNAVNCRTGIVYAISSQA